MAKWKINKKFKAIEVIWVQKPHEVTRKVLVKKGFKWSPKNRLWYKHYFSRLEMEELKRFAEMVTKALVKLRK